MTRLITTLIVHDARLQFRYGIYAAYGVVLGLYVGLLLTFGPLVPAWALALLIYTDPAALGFFFLGALMMLERAEGVRMALSVTPVGATAYAAAKVATLTTMALLASVTIAAAHPGGSNLALLFLTVALTSVQYIGIGIPIALHFRTVSGYLLGSAAFLTPLIAPAFLALIEPFPAWLLLIPAVAQLRLLLIATGTSASPFETGLALLVAAAACAAALAIGHASLKKELGK